MSGSAPAQKGSGAGARNKATSRIGGRTVQDVNGTPWVAAVDLGTTKTLALVAERHRSGVRLAGHGQATTRGLRKGQATDAETVARSIRLAVERACAGVAAAPPVWLGVAGADVHAEVAEVAVPLPEGRVRREDVRALRSLFHEGSLPGQRETVHVVEHGFATQPGRWLHQPVGRPGTELACRALVVTAPAGQLALLREAASAAGLDVAAISLNALAAAEAVLDPAEAEAGVAVVDIGGGTCDVAAFDRGRAVHVASIGLGSAYITNDLAIGLGIPWAAAETLKRRHARVDGALVQKTVEVAAEDGVRVVELPFVQEIVLARVDEILEAVRAALQEARARCRFGAGAVLTGGGASLKGLAKRAMDVWDLPVRLGVPQLGDERWAALESPQAAAAVGLLRLAARGAAPSARARPVADAPASIARRLMAWLAGLV